MNPSIVTIKTRYLANLELEAAKRRNWLRATLAYFAAGLLLARILLLTGCKTPSSPMTHAAFQAAVTLSEQIAIETHPETVPYLQAAVPVVCGVAHGTNVSAGAIVSALQTAGVTNELTKVIINGSIALLNVVVAGVGTNQNEINLYGLDLCNGMTAGLPTPGAVRRLERRGRNAPSMIKSPHLR